LLSDAFSVVLPGLMGCASDASRCGDLLSSEAVGGAPLVLGVAEVGELVTETCLCDDSATNVTI
jgi:hypothetical protein